MLEECWVRMKQFTMQIEAWEEMEADPCILGAVCVFSSLAQQFGDDYCSRNNWPRGKLGINFKGNRSHWMLIMLITQEQKCHRKEESVALDTKLLWMFQQDQCVCVWEVVVIFGYLAV
ncbi:hypothetical protein XELAEV_18010833mg [Xenopus laevis]|uniref:Uncharacterized protein n=1 Tax=Xenopus laevis TaxID=8355 RepID=A0A974I1W3_XENLA|nr:hypothetical protein XELAEV_18010833mg [Xenopus laevis]